MDNNITVNSKLNILSFTEGGSRLNEILCQRLAGPGRECAGYTVGRFAARFHLNEMGESPTEWIGSRWGEEAFLFIGAAGIAVRFIAPWVKDKFTDSAVLVMDEQGGFIVPLLSGHVGGAVEIAKIIAACTGAVPVITTATDVKDKFAVDVFAKKNNLVITDREAARKISAAVLEEIPIGFYSEFPIQGAIARELRLCKTLGELSAYTLGIAVTGIKSTIPHNFQQQTLFLLPQNIVAGIGCRRDVPAERLEDGLKRVLAMHHLLKDQVKTLASIDLKKDEAGIIKLAKAWKIPFITYSAQELNRVHDVSSHSDFVMKITGVDNVCVRAAKTNCPGGRLIQDKIKMDDMTLALIQEEKSLYFDA